MASVNVTDIVVRNPTAPFNTGFEFEITFECIAPLTDGASCGLPAARRCGRVPRTATPPGPAASDLPADLEWKVVYVGSASSPEHDQELDNVLVGPVPVGTSRFVLAVRLPSAAARGGTMLGRCARRDTSAGAAHSHTSTDAAAQL
jgi:histone chaperone ASF1